MTKQEIIAEINAKIAGQGTNIDAGSALPGILQGIIDLIPEAPTPQVQANLLETNPESQAYVNGICRLVVQKNDLLEVPEGWTDLFWGVGVPFVGTTTDQRLLPFISLTDTQKDELKSLVEQQAGNEVDDLIAFFGQTGQSVLDGTSGFAIVHFSGRVCYIYCDA